MSSWVLEVCLPRPSQAWLSKYFVWRSRCLCWNEAINRKTENKPKSSFVVFAASTRFSLDNLQKIFKRRCVPFCCPQHARTLAHILLLSLSLAHMDAQTFTHTLPHSLYHTHTNMKPDTRTHAPKNFAIYWQEKQLLFLKTGTEPKVILLNSRF